MSGFVEEEVGEGLMEGPERPVGQGAVEVLLPLLEGGFGVLAGDAVELCAIEAFALRHRHQP